MFKKGKYIIAAAIMLCSLVSLQSLPVQASSQATTNRRIVYTNGLDGQVVSINPDGSGRQEYGPGVFPKMSPDGKHIAFARDNTDFSARDLYVVDTDGSDLRKVAERMYSPDNSPAPLFTWSPGSTQLTFAATSLLDASKQIYTVKTDGTGQQQLTRDTANISNSNPVWSPDGKQILYQHDADLYTVSTDGSNQQLAVATATHGSWAPDASKILFTETGVGVRTANPNGSNRITLSPLGNNAVWSPDGTKIVMEAPACGCNTDPLSIITFSPDGTNKTIVAAPPTAGNVQHPVWSPDSKTIAFVEFASWQPARLVTTPATSGTASVVIVERVGYPEWAYTSKPAVKPAPQHPSLRQVFSWVYQWLRQLW